MGMTVSEQHKGPLWSWNSSVFDCGSAYTNLHMINYIELCTHTQMSTCKTGKS